MTAQNEDVIYITGVTPEGRPLIGGVWTLWHQDGFPLEMSYLHLRDQGKSVDWLEAMADATNNCPALMKHVEGFLDSETILAMKIGFVRQLNAGKTYEQILADKKQKAVR